jgi:chemotaxis protein MotB
MAMLLVGPGCVVGKQKHLSAVAHMQGEVDRLNAELATRTAERDALDAALAGRTGERDAVTAERDAARADGERLAEELRTLQAEIESTRDSLTRALAGRAAKEQEVAEMREALAELERRRAKADAALRDYRDLVGRFRSLIDAGTLRVRVIDGRMVVELATDILFDPGKADLSAPGRTALGEVAAVLASIPNRQFQVAGHTDNVPIHNERFPSNWQLGAARAQTVVDVLLGGGLSPDRVSAASYAEFKPAAPNATPEGRSHNRRIEIVVVPDLSELPGYDELQALDAESP